MLVMDLSGSTACPPPRSPISGARGRTPSTRSTRPTAPSIRRSRATPRDRRTTGPRPRSPPRSDRLQHAAQRRRTAADGLAGSPHGAGISTAAAGPRGEHERLRAGDDRDQRRLGNRTELANASSAAAHAKASGIRIVAVGIGTATRARPTLELGVASGYYQSGTPNPIDKTELIADLGAAVAVPVSFTLTETLGANFSAARGQLGDRSRRPGRRDLVWTGTLTGRGPPPSSTGRRATAATCSLPPTSS